jgi:hypothetical protein
MDEVERINRALMAEADTILYQHGVLDRLQPYGHPIVVGSYALQVMAWRDLDLSLVMEELTLPQFFALGRDLALTLHPYSMSFRDERTEHTPGRPRGLYWGVYTRRVGLDEWKIDLWAMTAEASRTRTQYVEHLNARLDAPNRRSILTIKHRVCGHPDYRRRFTSSDIYTAVLEHGITSIDEFRRWLKTHRGIEV